MKTQIAHTPTPPLTYRAVAIDEPGPGEAGTIYEYEIVDGTVVIARTYEEDYAAFIVKAVNCHEKLLEAIKALRETILNGEERILTEDEQEALIKSRNAIAKASGQNE